MTNNKERHAFLIYCCSVLISYDTIDEVIEKMKESRRSNK